MSDGGFDSQSEAQRIILSELDRIGAQFKGEKCWICCPFHVETTPSAIVNIDGENAPLGWLYCFGCGASEPWKEVAEELGLEIPGKGDYRVTRINTRITKFRNDMAKKPSINWKDVHLDLKVGISVEFPKDRVWRGVDGLLLNKIGARLGFSLRDYRERILLPVHIGKNFRGAISALDEKAPPAFDRNGDLKKGLPSYTNTSNPWAKSYGLFPYNYVKNMMSVIPGRPLALVEGQRDALKWIMQGIPALSIIGSKNWSEGKRNLVLQLNPGTILVSMDGDKAGIQASNTVSGSLRDYHRDVYVQRLADWNEELAEYLEYIGEKSVDPGNCPIEVVEEAKDILLIKYKKA